MSGRMVVTGADGYIGRRVAARFLADTDTRLVLTVRAADRAELDAKTARLLPELGPAADGRVEVLPADLTHEAPLAAVTGDITAVVHSAARTAFDVSRPVAERVNVDGTRRVAEFAARCPGLERLVLLSTLVSAGLRTGPVPETALVGEAENANHYEWSKAAGERLVAAEFPDLPLSVARLSTIVADDDRGAVTQYNVFHNTLKMFFYGLMTVMPGLPHTRLYLATAAFTSAAVVRLASADAPTGVYHLAPTAGQALPLTDVMDTAFDVFGEDPAFRRRRLLRPEFCDDATFRHLLAAADGLRGSPAAGALRTVAPFAEQMFHPKEFTNDRLREAWPDMPTPAGLPLVAATCRSLVATRWGRRGADAGPVRAGSTS